MRQNDKKKKKLLETALDEFFTKGETFLGTGLNKTVRSRRANYVSLRDGGHRQDGHAYQKKAATSLSDEPNWELMSKETRFVKGCVSVGRGMN